jgi:hypothetical protein
VNPGVDHPIEEWSDQELIDQYRYVAAEFSQDSSENRHDVKAQILEEIQKRGLEVPVDSSLDTPGREKVQEGITDIDR